MNLFQNILVASLIANGFDRTQINKIHEAMKHIEGRSCIQFRQRTNERNYVYINSYDTGCYSQIGMTGWGKQNLNLHRPDCFWPNGRIGTPVHEMMHALGFMHEHTRPDRDQYIRVNFGNIDTSWNARPNFEKNSYQNTDTFGTAYDTGSVMQYPNNLFSGNGYDTLTSLTGDRLGQYNGLSPTDVYEVNKLYNCDMSKVPTKGVKLANGNGNGNNNNGNNGNCKDSNTQCPYWAGRKECNRNPLWMKVNCKKSCNTC